VNMPTESRMDTSLC